MDRDGLYPGIAELVGREKLHGTSGDRVYTLHGPKRVDLWQASLGFRPGLLQCLPAVRQAPLPAHPLYLFPDVGQHTTGIGPIRPLPLEFQDDEQTYSVSNQYCYGTCLMVSFDHARIYLPKGKWTYYWDGRIFEGGRTLTNFGAPADELPVFVRAGAIIPMMPEMNYVGEKPIDPLIVEVYPQGTSNFRLYEDDGISYNYEKGDYCTTEYRAVQRAGSVAIDIGAREAPASMLRHKGTTCSKYIRVWTRAMSIWTGQHWRNGPR